MNNNHVLPKESCSNKASLLFLVTCCHLCTRCADEVQPVVVKQGGFKSKWVTQPGKNDNWGPCIKGKKSTAYHVWNKEWLSILLDAEVHSTALWVCTFIECTSQCCLNHMGWLKPTPPALRCLRWKHLLWALWCSSDRFEAEVGDAKVTIT